MKKILILALFFLINPEIIFSQGVESLLGIQSYSEFKRELDNINSLVGSSWDVIKPTYRFGYSANVQSRMFLFNSKAQNIQDETTVKTWYSYQLTPTLGITSEADYYFFTNTQVKTYQLKTGLEWTNSLASINPIVGWYSDSRSNRTDNGPIWALLATSKEFDLGDNFYTQLSGTITQADLSPRLYQRQSISSISRFESDELLLRFNGTYSFNQRDSYQPSSFFNRDITDIIEKVLSDSTSFQLNLGTRINEQIGFNLTLKSLYNIRDFQNKPLTETTSNSIIDTKYSRQEVFAIADLDYKFDWAEGVIGTKYSTYGLDAEITKTLNVTNELINRRNEQLRNTFFNQDVFELYGKLQSNLNKSNRFNISSTVSILHFDTPEENFDDRDELFTAFEIEHEYFREQTFQTSLLFSAEAYHRVFLFSQRSIENNWRRSLRFQPSMTWYPIKQIRWHNQFLVRANYTVYDFTDRDGTVRDQSSREWGLSTDFHLEFAKNWFNSWLFSRNQLIIGQLFWNEFSETPIDTLTTTRIESAIELIDGNNLIKVGIRVFIKDDYVPATVLRLQDQTSTFTRFTTGNQQTIQWGPTVSIRWASSKYGEITLDGWLQLQYLKNDWYITVPDEFNSLLMSEESYNRTRIFPNLSIRTKLYL